MTTIRQIDRYVLTLTKSVTSLLDLRRVAGKFNGSTLYNEVAIQAGSGLLIANECFALLSQARCSEIGKERDAHMAKWEHENNKLNKQIEKTVAAYEAAFRHMRNNALGKRIFTTGAK